MTFWTPTNLYHPGILRGVCVECLFLRTPSRAPYETPSAFKRAAYPDPPSVVPHPESIAAQAAYTEDLGVC